jgi:hypothetical protein
MHSMCPWGEALPSVSVLQLDPSTQTAGYPMKKPRTKGSNRPRQDEYPNRFRESRYSKGRPIYALVLTALIFGSLKTVTPFRYVHEARSLLKN